MCEAMLKYIGLYCVDIIIMSLILDGAVALWSRGHSGPQQCSVVMLMLWSNSSPAQPPTPQLSVNCRTDQDEGRGRLLLSVVTNNN